MWYPMAVVIMFGLASGTLLALGLVPVLPILPGTVIAVKLL